MSDDDSSDDEISADTGSSASVARARVVDSGRNVDAAKVAVESATNRKARANELFNKTYKIDSLLSHLMEGAVSVSQELRQILDDETTEATQLQESTVGDECRQLHTLALKTRTKYTAWSRLIEPLQTKHSIETKEYRRLAQSVVNDNGTSRTASLPQNHVEAVGVDVDATEAVKSLASQRRSLVKELIKSAKEIDDLLRGSIRDAVSLSEELRRILEEERADTVTQRPEFCVDEECRQCHTLALATRDGYTAWCSELRLIEFCFNLRCNDEMESGVYTDCYRNGCGKYIGDALRQNTEVYIVDLHLESLLEEDDDMQSSSSLVEFVRSSSMLCDVRIYGDKNFFTGRQHELTLLFFDAVAKNENIESLFYCGVVPAVAFYSLMSTTQSLKTLDLVCFDSDDDLPDDHALIQRAFASNHTIEHVRLNACSDEWTVAENILLQLHNGPTTLCRLTLYGDVYSYSTMQQHLCHTTTTQHLELSEFSFDVGNVDFLIDGIKEHYCGSLKPSLTKLTFKGCTFDAAAMDKFVKFMQIHIDRNEYHGTLRELEFDFEAESKDVAAEDTFSGASFSDVIMSILKKPCETCGHEGTTICDTFGSQIHSLSLLQLEKLPGFCGVLADSASDIHIECLRLSEIRRKDSLALAACLPLLVSVRELYLDSIDYFGTRDSVEHTFLNSFRKNGSLHITTISGEFGSSFHNYDILRNNNLTLAYCQRNRNLIGMLSNIGLASAEDAVAHEVSQEHTEQDSSPCQVELLPTLMCASNVITLLRSRYLLLGLLSAAKSIGPHHGQGIPQKRKCGPTGTSS